MKKSFAKWAELREAAPMPGVPTPTAEVPGSEDIFKRVSQIPGSSIAAVSPFRVASLGKDMIPLLMPFGIDQNAAQKLALAIVAGTQKGAFSYVREVLTPQEMQISQAIIDMAKQGR